MVDGLVDDFYQIQGNEGENVDAEYQKASCAYTTFLQHQFSYIMLNNIFSRFKTEDYMFNVQRKMYIAAVGTSFITWMNNYVQPHMLNALQLNFHAIFLETKHSVIIWFVSFSKTLDSRLLDNEWRIMSWGENLSEHQSTNWWAMSSSLSS